MMQDRGRTSLEEDRDPLIYNMTELSRPPRTATTTPAKELEDPFKDPFIIKSSSSLYEPSIHRASVFLPDGSQLRPESRSLDHHNRLSTGIEEYFTGPRDVHRHSKWPMFLRMHGSILPKMIVPLLFLTTWATAITCINEYGHDISFNHVLLTVTGFVVGLSLSFRSTTAYERYNEGRKYWAQLMLNSRGLARLIWLHSSERHEESAELGKQDVLQKLAALNLVNAFAVALKHRLRFEPSVEYPDLVPLVSHLRTFASEAEQPTLHARPKSFWHTLWQHLGLSIAQSNPRKLVKQAKHNLGNTPLEILSYLSCYFEHTNKNGTLEKNMSGAHVLMAGLVDVLGGCERVVNTPLPIAYSISMSQIMWAYVLSLPFQLYGRLGIVTIPGTIIAGYIILGIAQIGRELENPFGHDVNDLPLDSFCHELASDIEVMTSKPPPSSLDDWMKESGAQVMWPFHGDYKAWEDRSMEEIRHALTARAASKTARMERSKTFHQSHGLGSDV